MHVKVGPDGGECGEGGSPKHAYPAGRWPPHHASAPCSHPRRALGQDILREAPRDEPTWAGLRSLVFS
jgi:hypothetical protein